MLTPAARRTGVGPFLNDVEQRLQAALLSCASADEAIWMLHQDHQVGQVLLSRAVATVFGLTLMVARQVVADAVHRQGIPPLEPQLSEEVGWPDREAGVLDTLEQTSPFWQHLASHEAIFRACFLPSWDRPLLISVVLAPTPLLRALATEPFSGPNPRGQVRVHLSKWQTILISLFEHVPICKPIQKCLTADAPEPG